ncbi:dimethylsulfonioproprionate lyase family protein [Aliiroseovarius sp.]|uniref:dimethylsulfonioproprionate lyase family protein n=1 Tax=Aliiroseovarius sp. TaxID=1872442 RepID=UPI0026023746|nr:dimethylsulfonioproprionate lyase family protein [Aliiroseovarius sp.]
MSIDARWRTLLSAARTAHDRIPALGNFCPFPEDLRPAEPAPHHIPASDLLVADRGLYAGDATRPLRDAFTAVAPIAQWRETYRGTGIGEDFLSRFGCYCLIGQGGAWRSGRMAAYVVYMPPGLHYPWHHHPAEEQYLVLGGEARFMRGGEPDEVLRPGDVSFHASNQPHAMETGDHPVMAYVLWRNGFQTAPVLSGDVT